MNSLIDSQEINNVLFAHTRGLFSADNSSGEALSFKGDDGVNFTAKMFSFEKDAPVILFFPSCELSLSELETMAEDYVKEGINLMLLSYRVDNSSEENTTLAKFLKDSHFLFDSAIEWLGENDYTGKIFIMGQSVGSVAAIDITYEKPDSVKALFLESAMCDTASYLGNLGIETDSIADLEEKGFGNVEKIEKITKPTFVFHGASDPRIPISVAEKLQACSGARSKQFFVIPGGKHEYLYKAGGALYYETIKNFIDTICGVNTWRQKRRKYKESRKG